MTTNGRLYEQLRTWRGTLADIDAQQLEGERATTRSAALIGTMDELLEHPALHADIAHDIAAAQLITSVWSLAQRVEGWASRIADDDLGSRVLNVARAMREFVARNDTAGSLTRGG